MFPRLPLCWLVRAEFPCHVFFCFRSQWEHYDDMFALHWVSSLTSGNRVPEYYFTVVNQSNLISSAQRQFHVHVFNLWAESNSLWLCPISHLRWDAPHSRSRCYLHPPSATPLVILSCHILRMCLLWGHVSFKYHCERTSVTAVTDSLQWMLSLIIYYSR